MAEQGVAQPSVWRRAVQLEVMTLVAGAGLLVELVTTVPEDFEHFSPSNWEGAYTALVFEKYAYVLWFAAYFLVGKIRREGAKERREYLPTREFCFDVLQVAAGLFAAWHLGFLAHRVDPPTAGGFAVAVGAIFLISSVSAFLFRDADVDESVPTLAHVRIAGAAVSVAALVITIVVQNRAVLLAIVVALTIVLYSLLLGRFGLLMLAREARVATVRATGAKPAPIAAVIPVPTPPPAPAPTLVAAEAKESVGVQVLSGADQTIRNASDAKVREQPKPSNPRVNSRDDG